MIKFKKSKISLGRFVRKTILGYRRLAGLIEPKKAAAPIGLAEAEGIPIIGFAGKVEKEKKPAMDLSKINIAYPLIPRAPKRGEQVFAFVNIKWSPVDSALVYYLVEPALSEEDRHLLEDIKTTLIEKLDVDFSAMRKGETKEYLKVKFEELVNLLAAELPEQKKQQLLYYIERDFIGLGKIEPIMVDPNIEDISCDGVSVPIYIYHRNPHMGSLRTNIAFDSAEEVDSFVNKLAQRCGKTVSVAQPLVDATLPDGSRLQITLGTDIARRGSNFSIRKFTEEPLTPVHVANYNMLDSKMLAYLWMATEYGKSTLIAGGTATGKTSLLNALSLFIKPELKIVSIEDTAELRLPHPHWVPQVARQPIAELAGKKLGEVDMFDLLRESLRQRPDFIIVGEVRGREAYVLFQQIATGHTGLSTIHADTMDKLVDRLTTPPISLPPSLLENLDIIIFIVRLKYGNIYVRRVSNIFEITGFNREKNIPIINEIFRWNTATDKFDAVNPSIVLKRITERSGLSSSDIQREIGNRIDFLDWLKERNITDYRSFSKLIRFYYVRKEELMAAIK